MTTPRHALCILALLFASTACGEGAPTPAAGDTRAAPASTAADHTADAPTPASAPAADDALAQADPQDPFGALGLPQAPPKPVENLKEKVSYMLGQGFGQDLRQRDPDLDVDFDSARSGADDALGEQSDNKFSYAVGLSIGASIQQGDEEMDVEQLVAGIRAALTDKTAKSASYAHGYSFARGLKEEQIEVDLDTVVAGWKHGMNPEVDARYSEEEMQAAGMAFQQQMMEKAMARQQKQAADNLAEAETFLAENARKQGVQTTASGLQ